MKNLNFLLLTILLTVFTRISLGQGDFLVNYPTPSITSTNPFDFSSAGVLNVTTSGEEGYVTFYQKSNNTGDFIIVRKTNYSNSTLWTLKISSSDAPNIAFDSDNSTGDVYLACYIDSRMHVIKLDPSGNITYSKKYQNSLPNKLRVIKKNGSTYISVISTTSNKDANLLTINPSGGLESSINFTGDMRGVAFNQMSNENLVVCLSQKLHHILTGLISTCEIDPITGNQIGTWTQYFESNPPNDEYKSHGYLEITDILEFEDISNQSSINYLLAGYRIKSNTKKSVLIQLDETRNLTWSYTYDKIRTFNSLTQNGNKIYSAAIRTAGRFTSFMMTGGQPIATEASDVLDPSNPASLWASIPYAFEIGPNNQPLYSLESGQLDFFPLFSLQSNKRIDCEDFYYDEPQPSPLYFSLFDIYTPTISSVDDYSNVVVSVESLTPPDLFMCQGPESPKQDNGGNNLGNNYGTVLSDETSDFSGGSPKIDIYPNPNNGVFRLKFQSLLEGEIELTIFDVTGRVVLSNSFNKTGSEFIENIQLSDFNAGVYMVAVKFNGEISYQKFTIQ